MFRINDFTPVFAPDDLGQGGEPPTDAGQGGEPPVGDGPGIEEPEPFHVGPDGTKYTSKEELAKAFNEHFLRRDDYSRKTQTLARERDEFLQRQKDFDQRYKDFTQKEKDWEIKDRFLKENPGVFEELNSRMKIGKSPQEFTANIESLIDEKYGPKLKEFEDWKEQQERERELNSVFDEFGGKYEDFDRDAIRRAMEEFGDGGMSGLVEMIYHALRGKALPAAEKAAANLQTKKGAKLSPGTGSTPPPKGKQYKTIEEAKQAALEDADDY